jgi:hypothetical protein
LINDLNEKKFTGNYFNLKSGRMLNAGHEFFKIPKKQSPAGPSVFPITEQPYSTTQTATSQF